MNDDQDDESDKAKIEAVTRELAMLFLEQIEQQLKSEKAEKD